MKIMFVDDDTSILSAFKRAFYRSGWDIKYVKDGTEALELLESFQADFIITDMKMPGMNGAELLEQVSKLYPSAVRIVLSGHADEDLSVRASYVAHQWYDKPCNLELLKSEIELINEVRADLPYSKIQALLGGINSLPSIPKLFIKLKAMLHKQTISMEDISVEISKNPSLTAKVLQVANTSFFVTGANVNKVEDAIIRLGTDVICNIVAISEMYSNMGDTSNTYIAEILNRALDTANIATHIADKPIKDEAMLAGLLHNLGELLLPEISPEHMEGYLAKRIIGADNSALETTLFQVDNIQITSYLLHLWHFPYSLIRSITLQNNLEKLVIEELNCEVILHLAKSLQSNQELDERLSNRKDISIKLKFMMEQ
ncbi:HDOD domain-containing protein [uncultured Paraglaciecola sp.]|uniref:HDOD domain-containing protein n=1 Tax=uncultured Paraglaciecola sp. TaxID=1765024 RepID=UPI00259385FC|nr:HDOD domain-containing protein [uncultured Paraglaciecola sp.]